MPRKPMGDASRPLKPATTPEGREAQLIDMAMVLAERRLREGTATSQELTHFLKLGSSREMLEQERIRHENELAQVKMEQIASQARVEELYRDALSAMSRYQGREAMVVEDRYDD